MKRLSWEFYFTTILLAFSTGIFYLHYIIFQDSDYIFMYLVADIALIPINLLLATFVLQQILDRREKQMRYNKMHMVIGAFFSEVGTDLIRILSEFDVNAEKNRSKFLLNKEWFENNNTRKNPLVKDLNVEIKSTHGDINQLRALLATKRDFLLRLLENPNLLEHEVFTDLLWAVFHLAEELACRNNLQCITTADQEHLSGDIRRAYKALVLEWLSYMKHLSTEYPYLFSLALRTNPFDPMSSPELK